MSYSFSGRIIVPSDLSIWIDMEFSGLDPEVHEIMEIAALICTPDLTIVDTLHLVVKPKSMETMIEHMNSWSKRMHHKLREDGESLVHKCSTSTNNIKDADIQLSTFMDKYRKGSKMIISGSTVHKDLTFIEKHMPLSNKDFTIESWMFPNSRIEETSMIRW